MIIWLKGLDQRGCGFVRPKGSYVTKGGHFKTFITVFDRFLIVWVDVGDQLGRVCIISRVS